MTDRELLEMIANQVGALTGQITTLDNKVDKIDSRMTKLENTVTRIENNHGIKLEALFDGYTQNTEQLTRIETEIAKHEEVIIRRVK